MSAIKYQIAKLQNHLSPVVGLKLLLLFFSSSDSLGLFIFIVILFDNIKQLSIFRLSTVNSKADIVTLFKQYLRPSLGLFCTCRYVNYLYHCKEYLLCLRTNFIKYKKYF